MYRLLSPLAGLMLLGMPAALQAQNYELLYNWRHEGAQPTGRLLYANGAYFGTTFGGGAMASGLTNFDGRGTAFRLNANGKMDILHQFDGFNLGANPEGGLTLGQDGNLYGVAKFGVLGSDPNGSGSGGHGTIYQITPGGVGTRVFALSGNTVGAQPVGELLERSTGKFLGTTANLISGNSVLFENTPNPFAYNTLASFNESVPGKLFSGLIRGTDGNFYGTSRNRVFRVNDSDNAVTYLYSSTGSEQGSQYGYGVTQGPDGRLYGITENGGDNFHGVIWAMNLDGTGYTVLRHLSMADGRLARCRLLVASDGALYGTTRFGGTNDLGTLFKITTQGEFTKLHDFAGEEGSDPRSLIEVNGKLAGIAATGGLTNRGVIFEATFGGEVTVIKHLGSPDGFIPNGQLTFASDGNFYGVLAWGGPAGNGAIYRLTPGGEVELVYGLKANEGIHPKYRLIEGADGALYGVTVGSFTQLQGSVFRVTKDGSSFTTLHAFAGVTSDPAFGGIRGPLVERPDGRLYGFSGQGSFSATKVFRLSATAGYQTTKEFQSNQLHSVLSRYFMDEAGAIWFFATDNTANNGSPAVVLFKLTKDGALTNISSTGFSTAITAPVQGADGAFYLVMRQNTPIADTFLVRVSMTGEITSIRLYFYDPFDGGFRGDLVEGERGFFYATRSTSGSNGTLTYDLRRINAATGEVSVMQNLGTLDPYRRVSLTQFITTGIGGTVVPGGIYVDPSLTIGPDGHLYGTVPQDTAQAGGQVYRYTLPARTGTKPAVQTGDSSGVTATSATLNAAVFPNGGQTYASIEYGRTTAYGYRTFPYDAGIAGVANRPFSLDCLSPGTTYHYRIVADGPGGIVYGPDMTFTTLPNLPPVANSDSAQVRIVGTPQPIQISVLLNDSDPENDPLSIESFTLPTKGAVTLNSGVFTYSPGTNFTGTDSFTYTITDGITASTAVVVITPTGNQAPLAVNDTGHARAKEKVTVAVLANDSDPEQDHFSVTSFSQGSYGKVTRVNDTLVYVPGPKFKGVDTFIYTITDAFGATATAQVNIANPFASLKGSYSVLLDDGRGLLKLTVGPTGSFTGTVRVPSGTVPIKGVLAFNGNSTTTVTRKNSTQVTVNLNFDAQGLSGQVIDGWTTFPFADASPNSVGLPSGIFLGAFTAVLYAPAGSPAALNSYGWVTGRTLKTGQVTLAGQLPDGSAFSLAGAIQRDKSLIIYKATATTSWLTELEFATAPQSDFTGRFRWRRNTLTKGFYLPAVDLTYNVQGARYVTVKGARTLTYTGLGRAHLAVTGGDLADYQETSLAKTVAVSASDVLTVTGPTNSDQLKINIARKTGVLSGSFRHLALDPRKPAVKFKGVLLQTPPGGTGPNQGYGLFLGPTRSGRVEYTPE